MLRLDDHELVRRYQRGEEAAFEALVTRHKDKVYSHIFFMVKEDALAEDIFQDAFIKVVRTLKEGKYNEEGKFLPWVLKIAHNLVIDHFRKKKKMNPLHSTEENDIFAFIEHGDPLVDEKMFTDQRVEMLRDLVRDLPQEQKEVVIMRHSLKMSFKEIAARTDVSINTALGRMRYALINLRKMVGEHDVELMEA